jgi:hypothetical protein
MRLVASIFLITFSVTAQVDPGYVVPKENPFTTPSDLKRGEQLFLGQAGGFDAQQPRGLAARRICPRPWPGSGRECRRQPATRARALPGQRKMRAVPYCERPGYQRGT